MVNTEKVARATTDLLLEFDSLTIKYPASLLNKSLTGKELEPLEEAAYRYLSVVTENPVIYDVRILDVLGTLVLFGTTEFQLNGIRKSGAPAIAARAIKEVAHNMFGYNQAQVGEPYGHSELSAAYRTKVINGIYLDLVNGLVYGGSELRVVCSNAIEALAQTAYLLANDSVHAEGLLTVIKDLTNSCQQLTDTRCRKLFINEIQQAWQMLLNYAL